MLTGCRLRHKNRVQPRRIAGSPHPYRQSTRLRSGPLGSSACSARSTTRSTFYLVLPASTLTAGFLKLRCLSRTTLAFQSPPDYGSGGQPDVLAAAAHWGSVPVGHRCGVVNG